MGAPVDILRMLVHTVTVERLTGRSVTGPVYATGEEVQALVIDKRALVKSPNGETLVSPTGVHMPDGTDYIPVGSRVTLPSQFGGGTREVVECSILSTGIGTPDHVEVRLL